jgi:HSP20 family molecular chaperone IbpA
MPMYQMPTFYGRDPRGCHPPPRHDHQEGAGPHERPFMFGPNRGCHPPPHHDHPEGAGPRGGHFMFGPNRGCHPPPQHDHQEGAGPREGPSMFGPHRGPHGRPCHPHCRGWSSEEEPTPPTRCGPLNHLARKHWFLSLLEEQNKRAMMEQQHANEKNDETSRSFVAPQHVHRNESEKATTLSIDVTGFSLSDLEVRLEKHILTLHGTRKNRIGDIFVLHRQVALDETIHNENAVEAHIDDCVLEITIAKKNTPVNFSIPIRAVIAEPREEKLIQEAEIVFEAHVDTLESTPAAQDDTPAANETPTPELQPSSASDEESVHVETVKNDDNEGDEQQSWEEVDGRKY